MSTILLFHITAGAIALLTGAAALTFAKGSPRHRAAGTIFFYAMLAMASLGGLVAIAKPIATYVNSLASGVTLYLVATSWMAVRRPERTVGAFDYAALAWIAAIAAWGFSLGLQAPIREPGVAGNFPTFPYFMFGSIALIAALGDVRMLARGGVAGSRRMTRHLWRMGVALLIAAMSFFLGQADEFPQAVREAKLLVVPVVALPVIAVAAVTLYWFVRARFTRWWREDEPAAEVAVEPAALVVPAQ